MTGKLSIRENILRLREEIAQAAAKAGRKPEEIRLMAVTKTQPPELVNEAIAAGIDLIGENKAQELTAKYDEYHKENLDIHFIGHLQTNKVKAVVGKVGMIQSVDSLKLAGEIARHSEKLGITTDLLLEINVAGEQSKSGVLFEDAETLAREIAALSHVKLRGLMAIPPIWNESAGNEVFFERMRQKLVDIKAKNIDNISMEILSMGMTDDFAIAIKHGSTLVRLGTAIFGSRY